MGVARLCVGEEEVEEEEEEETVTASVVGERTGHGAPPACSLCSALGLKPRARIIVEKLHRERSFIRAPSAPIAMTYPRFTKCSLRLSATANAALSHFGWFTNEGKCIR